MAIFIPISIRSKCCPDAWFKVDDVTIVGISKKITVDAGMNAKSPYCGSLNNLIFIGSDGDTRQVQWCDTFWISCKARSTWKRPKPEITARDKYLKDQDNTSDLKLPLRFSSSNAKLHFHYRNNIRRTGIRTWRTMEDKGVRRPYVAFKVNLFWHLGLSTERTFI